MTVVFMLAACQPVASPAPTLSPTEPLSPHALAASSTPGGLAWCIQGRIRRRAFAR